MSQINEQILPPRINLPSLEKNVLELRALKDFFLTGLISRLSQPCHQPDSKPAVVLVMPSWER